MLHLVLPWPPSLNRIWRATAGRVVLSATARKYHRAVAAALPTGRVPPPLTGPLSVVLVLNPPSDGAQPDQRWDIANREKCLCDALTKQRVWLDDSQIDDLRLIRGSPVAGGSVDVYIETIP